jgi:hydrogenase maturation protein HypF
VATLRERKHRPAKPFAVMMPDLAMVRRYCEVSPEEETLLTGVQAPIVLLARRPGVEPAIAEEVAPKQRMLGVMLPYTPLHHLILEDAGRLLVMTSGNLSEEPIARENDEALRRLGGLADVFLFHDREIHARYDDSLWMVEQAGEESRPQPIRRARGYAPSPVRLPFEIGSILAVGADLKNTFCVTRERYAFLSQHIGDMENLETEEHFEQALALYRHLFRLEPQMVVSDLHPGYSTTRLAERLAATLPGAPLPLVRVQHHAAHIAACLADNGWTREAGPVIGVAFDGTGYGEDGAIWGGEWLIGDYRGFRRAAQLDYLPLPGGDAAIRHPGRIALAYLQASGLLLQAPREIADLKGAPMVLRQLEQGLNVVPTSSMGRLFDAVSALLGVALEATYEGQAAIEMEQVAWTGGAEAATAYPFELREVEGRLRVLLAPMLAALLEERRHGVPAAISAARFHVTVAEMTAAVCGQLRADGGPSTAALSGGVFQNGLLLGLTVKALRAAGFEVLWPRQVPANDGGLALGQAVLAEVDSRQ